MSDSVFAKLLWSLVVIQMHSEIQESFAHHHASESAAVDAVSAKQELSSEAWQYLDAKDGTLSSSVGISDIYKRHRISEDSGLVSQHAVPWYPYDAFGTLNAAFGAKLPPEKIENPIHVMVKTEPQSSEPADLRMEFGDSGVGVSGGHWELNKFGAGIDGGEGSIAHADFDRRPLRVVASVAPTQFASAVESAVPIDSRSTEMSTSHFLPPPLVPLQSTASVTGQVLTSFGGHTPNATASSLEAESLRGRHASPPLRELRSPADEVLLESEPEELDDGHCSPPPQRVYEEDHHSTSAM